jgi:hypothetical protein
VLRDAQEKQREKWVLICGYRILRYIGNLPLPAFQRFFLLASTRLADNMPFVDSATNDVDKSFVQIANADIEVILKQLTQDEKVALLTGTCRDLLASTNSRITLIIFRAQAMIFGIPSPYVDLGFPPFDYLMAPMECEERGFSAAFQLHACPAGPRSAQHLIEISLSRSDTFSPQRPRPKVCMLYLGQR